MLSQIARSFLTRVSAKGLLFLVLPCDLPPWVLCTSTSSSFYTVTVLCLFLPSVCPISYFVLYIFSSFRCISFLFIFIFRDVASPFRSLFFFLSRVLFHFLHLHILCSFTILPFLLVSFVLLVVSLSSLLFVHIFTVLSRLFRYLRLSSICQILFLASRGRAFTRANGNILFTPFSLSSLNFAARLSVRFLFLLSLRSHEPFEVSNENRRSKLFLSFSFIFGFSRSFSFFFF